MTNLDDVLIFLKVAQFESINGQPICRMSTPIRYAAETIGGSR
jgi:hypothetical protein